MLNFIMRRLALMLVTLLAISFIAFAIIQLPPGDFLTTMQAEQAVSGGGMSHEMVDFMRERYGLNEPFLNQYVKWIAGFPRGDFGYSFEWNTPVWPLIADRMGYTILLGVLSLIVMFCLSIPIGIYSATHQ